MDLIELGEADRQRYNRFVMEHDRGDFLQSWDWGDWQKNLGRESMRFIVQHDGRTVLAAQLIRTAVPRTRQHYFYIPHGPLLARGVDDELGAQALNFFLDEITKLFPQTQFIRLEPNQSYLNLIRRDNIKQTVNIQAGKTLVLDLSPPVEQLLEAMHSKTRYNIKVAQRHQVNVESELVVMPQRGLHLPEVVSLITETAKRQRYRGYPAPYYKAMIDYFGTRQNDLRLTIYKAFFQKTLLVAAIMIDFGRTRSYLFGGSSPEHRNVMAPYLLHWQAIADAKAKGLTEYDFGGSETAGGKDNLGFNRFKAGFGPVVRQFPGTYDIVIKPLWYTIYTFLRSINRRLR